MLRSQVRTFVIAFTALALAHCSGKRESSTAPNIFSIQYSTSSLTLTRGSAVQQILPSLQGKVMSFYVSPSLPTGLYLDANTGVLYGTPTVAAAETLYTITAVDSNQQTTSAQIRITVKDKLLGTFAYATPSPTFFQSIAITDLSPVPPGTSISKYSVTPTLPRGLALNTTTGVVAGTPLETSGTKEYLITATASTGYYTAPLTITVNERPTIALSYSVNPAVYTKGLLSTINIADLTGTTASAFKIVPALPTGLSLDLVTGSITGTPTVLSGTTDYVVTATTAFGDVTAALKITVNDARPTSITYAKNPATYPEGTPIATNTATVSGGGPVTSYSVSPALPEGLTLDTSTGAITGTPLAPVVAAAYVVSASNSGGSASVTLNISVTGVAPSELKYAASPATYTQNADITANVPSNKGGKILSYSVKPALPPGLQLNTTTGVITGKPTGVSSATNYLIAGTNTTGATSMILNITVNPPKVVLPFSDDFSTPLNGGLNLSWLVNTGAVKVENGAATGNTGGANRNGGILYGLDVANVAVQAEVDVTGAAGAYSELQLRSTGTTAANMYMGQILRNGNVYQARLYRRANNAFAALTSGVNITGGKGLVRLEMVGNCIKMFWNGALVQMDYDNTFTSGSVGFMVPQNYSVKNFAATEIVPSAPALPFSTTFVTPGYGSQLNSNWRSQIGNFTVSNQSATALPSTWSVATLHGINLVDVHASAEIDVSAKNGIAGGVVARYSGPGDTNMYYAGVGNSNGQGYIQVWKNVGGPWTQLGGNVNLGSETKGTLAFEIINSSLIVFWNDALVYSWTDSSLSGGGTVGLRGLGTVFNSFETQSLR